MATELINGQVYATGGRVLNFVSLSENFLESRTKVINSINSLNWMVAFIEKILDIK